MLQTKFQAPDPSNSGEEDFLNIFHFLTQDPLPQGHFGPKDHHLNKLDRGPLGNATYHISRPVPGRPTIWITVGQGPTTLAVGAGGGCLDIFTLIYPFSPLSPSLWETDR